jgi:hypothetical protein
MRLSAIIHLILFNQKHLNNHEKTQLTVLFNLIFLQYSLVQELKDCNCEESYTNLIARIERKYPWN